MGYKLDGAFPREDLRRDGQIKTALTASADPFSQRHARSKAHLERRWTRFTWRREMSVRLCFWPDRHPVTGLSG